MIFLARGFNKVILMGNLTRDPEIRYTTSNQAVAKLTVAVNRIGRSRDGEVLEQVDFIPVVCLEIKPKIVSAILEKAARFLWKAGFRLEPMRLGVEKKSGLLK